MSDDNWWRKMPLRTLYTLSASAEMLRRGEEFLQREGWLPGDKTYFPVGANLLRAYLTAPPARSVAELMDEVRHFAERPRPYLPDPSNLTSAVRGAPARFIEQQRLWVNPARVFNGSEGLTSFFRDRGDWSENGGPYRDEPVRGQAEFAARIAAERGDPDGLVRLFGPDPDGRSPLSLQGWKTPLGAVFRVNVNGNHRLGALGVLGVPCVLADVTWNYGPFDTSAGTNAAEDELRASYRTLLHTFGIASYPDPAAINHTGIITNWPILIDTPTSAVASLQAMEAIADRQAAAVGRLHRASFDDAANLTHLSTRVRDALNAIVVDNGGSAPPRRSGWLARLLGR